MVTRSLRMLMATAVALLLTAGAAHAHQGYDGADGNVSNREIAFTDDEAGGCELFPGWEHCVYHQRGLGTVSRVFPDRTEPVHGDGSLLVATSRRGDRLRLAHPHRERMPFAAFDKGGLTLRSVAGEPPAFQLSVSCPEPAGWSNLTVTYAGEMPDPGSGWQWVDMVQDGEALWSGRDGNVKTLDELKRSCPEGEVTGHVLTLSSPQSRAWVDNITFGEEVTNFWVPWLARVHGHDYVRDTYAGDQRITARAVGDLVYRGWEPGYGSPDWADPNRARLPRARGFVVANQDSRWAAVIGAPLARSIGGPLMLGYRTKATTYGPYGTTAYLIGGLREFGRGAARDLRKAGYWVVRIAAPTPAETAVEVARFIQARTDRSRRPMVLAPRQVPSDALLAGGVAAHLRGAVLLTDGDKVPAVTRRYLREERRGGVFTVGRAAAAAMPGLPARSRILAPTPAATSVRVARTFFPEPGSVAVSSLDQPADALVAASYAGRTGHPLLLVRRDRVAAPVRRYLRNQAPRVDSSVLVGGRPAVSERTLRRLRGFLTPGS